MKRVLFSVVMLLVVGFAFAQEKNVKEAKKLASSLSPNFKTAQSLIDAALINAETCNNPETWNVAGFIQKRLNEEEMKKAFLKKPYDTLSVYNSVLKMYEYFEKCDELAQVPNEKGKIKNKYRKSNAASLIQERSNLINGGIYFFNSNRSKEAVKFFGKYVESASYPMFAENEAIVGDTLLPQIAYYATLAANSAQDKEAILKYAPIAIKDKTNGDVAMQLLCEGLKAKGDTIKWVENLQEGLIKFPSNQYFFAMLIDYYTGSNQLDKAMDFADKMLKQEPNNKLYLYVKGYLYHNLKKYDDAIVFYKKTIAQDPQYAEAYSNLGLVLLMKAQAISDNATTDINDPKYAESQKIIRKYYEEAKPYYEKTRDLKPDQKDLWAPGLYRVYYGLNMGAEFEEIEKIMNN